MFEAKVFVIPILAVHNLGNQVGGSGAGGDASVGDGCNDGMQKDQDKENDSVRPNTTFAK